MSLVVICKLNARYKEALNGGRFRYDPEATINTDTQWGAQTRHGPALKDRDKKPHSVAVSLHFTHNGMGCCGMEELDFQQLQKSWDVYGKDKDWSELVAKYIKHGINETDSRVVVTGLPIQVGNGSQYNVDFYNKLRETLESFGFRRIGAPYKNQNSGNTIVALAGQM